MVEIKNAKDLRTWLEDQPPEVSRIIAARAAARVVPLALPVLQLDDGATHFLSVLRAVAVAQSRLDNTAKIVAAEDAAWSTVRDTRDAAWDTANNTRNTARGVTWAACGTAGTAKDAVRGFARGAARNAADVANNTAKPIAWAAGDAAETTITAATGRDAMIAAQQGPQALRRVPLWEGTENPLTDQTAVFFEEVNNGRLAGHGWEIWVGWYQSLLDGTYDEEAWTFALDYMEEQDWNAGSANTNDRLIELLERYLSRIEESPDQLPEDRHDILSANEEEVISTVAAMPTTIPPVLPASYRFVWRNDEAVHAELNRHPKEDSSDAATIYGHVKDMLTVLIDRLKASNWKWLSPVFERSLSSLGEDKDSIKAGDLAAQTQMIDILIARYGLGGTHEDLGDELQFLLTQLGPQMGALLSAIPDLRLARDDIAMAQLDPSDIPKLRKILHNVADVAASEALVTENAAAALKPNPEIETAILAAETAPSSAERDLHRQTAIRMLLADTNTTLNFTYTIQSIANDEIEKRKKSGSLAEAAGRGLNSGVEEGVQKASSKVVETGIMIPVRTTQTVLYAQAAQLSFSGRIGELVMTVWKAIAG